MSETNISIGILSWGSPRTLHNTLTSYLQSGLLDITDDVIIYFQEVTERDIAIAQGYGITNIIGSDNNIGIGKAFAKLAKAAKHTYFLPLENDWVNIEDFHTTVHGLEEGKELLRSDTCDVIRYRSRHYPGDPLYTRQFMGRELEQLSHIGEAHHWLENPSEQYPLYFTKIGYSPEEPLYLTSSRYCNFTNNPCLYKREFYLDKVTPFATGMTLENEIQSWWEQQDFRVVLGGGLFTHVRLDRG